MGSFLLYEIRNVLRLEGYEVTKHTNRRVICSLLELKKDSTLSSICDKLKMSYMRREGDFAIDNNSTEFFLHFLDKKTTLSFASLKEASRKLGVNLFFPSKEERESKIIEKIILVNGEKAVVSFSNVIDRNFDFPLCLENKININLALSTKLGYTVNYDISFPEIFSLLGEKIPHRKLKERLCQILEIPYFFVRKDVSRKNKKIIVKTQDEEILMFTSLHSAGRFFQISSATIGKMIDLNYRLPFWFKRYSLEFA